MQNSPLFKLLQGGQPQQQQNLGAAALPPLPTGNVGGGATQPLQPGPMMVADNSDITIDPDKARQLRQGMQGQPSTASKLFNLLQGK